MKKLSEIAKRIWREPAVAIGFVTTLIVIVVTVILGNDWDVPTIVGALAPLTAALGIRGQVSPVVGKYEESAAAATAATAAADSHQMDTQPADEKTTDN